MMISVGGGGNAQKMGMRLSYITGEDGISGRYTCCVGSAGESVGSYLLTRIDFKWRLAPGAGLMRFHCYFFLFISSLFLSLSFSVCFGLSSKGYFITRLTTTTTTPLA